MCVYYGFHGNDWELQEKTNKNYEVFKDHTLYKCTNI